MHRLSSKLHVKSQQNPCITGSSVTDNVIVPGPIPFGQCVPRTNNVGIEFSLGIQTLNLYSLPEYE